MLSDYNAEPTPEERARIVELTRAGLSALRIAETLGTYPERVREIQHEEGIISKHARTKVLPTSELRKAWYDGCHDAEIARRTGVSASAVRKWRKQEGLPARTYIRRGPQHRAWNRKEARRLYEAGLSDARIADAVGVSQPTICKWRRESGLPANFRRPFSEDDIRMLYGEGLTDREIGRRLGVSETVAAHWRKSNELPPNTPEFDTERARELYDRGLVDREIAEALGTTRVVVRNWRGRNGLSGNGAPKFDHETAYRMWEEGASDGQIAKELGNTAAAVYQWRRRNGLKANGRSGCRTE